MLLAQSAFHKFAYGFLGPYLREHVFVKTNSNLATTLASIAVLLGGVLIFLSIRGIHPKQRKRLIVGITFLAALYYLLEFIIPGYGPKSENFLTKTWPSYNLFTRVMGAWTFGLGLINILMIHGANVGKRKKGWYNSAGLFVAMIVMGIFTIWKSIPHSAGIQQTYEILFYGFFTSLKQGMWSVLAFYIASAAYRAFRLKSGEATLMMVTAILVMLGQVPFGIALTSNIPADSWWVWAQLQDINTWLQLSPGMAARRAILLGASVGGLAISLRIWLSLERGAYFDQEL